MSIIMYYAAINVIILINRKLLHPKLQKQNLIQASYYHKLFAEVPSLGQPFFQQIHELLDLLS